MRPVLLIDFGSTYTKVTAVDTEAGTVTVNVNKPEAKFLKAELSLTKAPTVE